MSVKGDIQQKFNDALDECTRGLTGPFGVAVSGGSDSLGLLILAQNWAALRAVTLRAVTVDHQLRETSRTEAQDVAALCATLGIEHSILTWRNWDGQGNKAQAAREARYGLMGDWASACGVDALLLGHTVDDQAETLLMALARKSGVNGLAAMQPRRDHNGIALLRPTLAISREELRAMLTAQKITWVDDPSNDDITTERIQKRQLLAELGPHGLSASVLAQVAANMQTAKAALAQLAHDAAQNIVRFQVGEINIDRDGLARLPTETQFRLLAHTLTWLSSASNRPRHSALTGVLQAAMMGQTATLHGCVIYPKDGQIIISREAVAITPVTALANQPFDGRWHLSGPVKQGQMIAPLGQAGLGLCPDWRKSGMTRFGAMASPSVWQNGVLIAAPQLDFANGWQIDAAKDAIDYYSSLLGH